MDSHDPSALIDIEDLVTGKNEWLNIPSSVRLAFKYVLVQQRKAYETINAQSLLLQQLSAEAKRHESLLQDSQLRLDNATRDSRDALDRCARLDKANAQLQAALSAQMDARQSGDARSNELEHGVAQLRAAVESKASAAELAELVHILQRLQANKAEKSALQEVAKGASDNGNQLQELAAQLGHFSQANAHAQAQLGEAVQQLQQRVAVCPTNVDMELKASRAEVTQLLQQKADKSDAKKLQQDTTASRAEVEALKKTTQIIFEAMHTKADVTAVKNSLGEVRDETLTAVQTLHDNTQGAIDTLKSSIALKANTDEVEKVLSTRAGPEDLHSIVDLLDSKADVVEVRAVESRLVTRDDFDRHTAQQSKINTVLCSEFSTARWIWKTGRTEKAGSVPWNAEVTNTDPSNFLWEKNSTAVVTVAPGLYEINAAFFTSRSAKITLFVNDVPVLSRETSPATLLTMAGKKALKPSGSTTALSNAAGSGTVALAGHPDGNVFAGINICEFLALPPRALVSITFAGEETTQGFLGLRKL